MTDQFSALTSDFSPESKARVLAKFEAIRAHQSALHARAKLAHASALASVSQSNGLGITQIEDLLGAYLSQLRSELNLEGGELFAYARFAEGDAPIWPEQSRAIGRAQEQQGTP